MKTAAGCWICRSFCRWRGRRMSSHETAIHDDGGGQRSAADFLHGMRGWLVLGIRERRRYTTDADNREPGSAQHPDRTPLQRDHGRAEWGRCPHLVDLANFTDDSVRDWTFHRSCHWTAFGNSRLQRWGGLT